MTFKSGDWVRTKPMRVQDINSWDYVVLHSYDEMKIHPSNLELIPAPLTQEEASLAIEKSLPSGSYMVEYGYLEYAKTFISTFPPQD